MERFTVTRVSNKEANLNNRNNTEVTLDVGELRKNSHSVPVNSPDRRKFSFAQLTR